MWGLWDGEVVRSDEKRRETTRSEFVWRRE
jgi:hypothetical protein